MSTVFILYNNHSSLKSSFSQKQEMKSKWDDGVCFKKSSSHFSAATQKGIRPKGKPDFRDFPLDKFNKLIGTSVVSWGRFLL